MEAAWALISAILPAALLIVFIYWKDKEHPEPVKMILKGFFFGCLSIIVSITFSIILEIIRPGIFDNTPVLHGIFVSFFDAALPEESAKLLMLWLLLRKNKEFDESLDGIVYAVCVGMGFACIENIEYVFEADKWAGVAIVRALLAVPGHYIDAVLMGFFYSLVHFMPKRFARYRFLVWFVPFLSHGIYDSLCFTIDEWEAVAGIAFLALLYFSYRMHKFCLSRIKSITLIDKDFQDARLFESGMKNNRVE